MVAFHRCLSPKCRRVGHSKSRSTIDGIPWCCQTKCLLLQRPSMLRKLSILGPGLLGGSIGLAARHRKIAERVVIWARRPESADQAWQLGAADEATNDLVKAVADAELVVLATPIGVMRPLIDQIRPALPDGCVVTDVG